MGFGLRVVPIHFPKPPRTSTTMIPQWSEPGKAQIVFQSIFGPFRPLFQTRELKSALDSRGSFQSLPNHKTCFGAKESPFWTLGANVGKTRPMKMWFLSTRFTTFFQTPGKIWFWGARKFARPFPNEKYDESGTETYWFLVLGTFFSKNECDLTRFTTFFKLQGGCAQNGIFLLENC